MPESSSSSSAQRIPAMPKRNPVAPYAGIGSGALVLATILTLLRSTAEDAQAVAHTLTGLGLIGALVAIGVFVLAAVIVGWVQTRDEHRDEVLSSVGDDMRNVLAQLVKGQERHAKVLDEVVVEVRSLKTRMDEISRPVPIQPRHPASTRIPSAADWANEDTDRKR